MIARVELERLYDRDGFLTPEQVVTEATDAAHPLHRCFEWDDTEAGRRYRLHQAGLLIRSCRITVDTAPEITKRVRSYVNLPNEEGGRGTYVATRDALTDNRRDVVLTQVMRDIAALRRKYEGLIDFDAALETSIRERSAA
jgi:hypothetical protein